ncbi:hypothetical protein [Pseudomonas sp. TUM22785]|uniref:hypothetical protein n=1 Tax=Pseudomonas sp. TUM22785 TaxID=3019098 RepID=UPI002306CFFB|nr:hypothetical protein [Pseudomonas sp. TUM22785]WCD77996.1 hypothetical protein PI990_18520 [Pseudomonas sp. TUM22785]
MSDDRQEGDAASAANADFACLAKQVRLYRPLAFPKLLAHEFALQRETLIQSKIPYAARQFARKTTPACRKQMRLRHNPLKGSRIFHA